MSDVSNNDRQSKAQQQLQLAVNVRSALLCGFAHPGKLSQYARNASTV